MRKRGAGGGGQGRLTKHSILALDGCIQHPTRHRRGKTVLCQSTHSCVPSATTYVPGGMQMATPTVGIATHQMRQLGVFGSYRNCSTRGEWDMPTKTTDTIKCPHCSVCQELSELRDEFDALCEDAFRQIACYCDSEDDPRNGWWDTMALSTARELGDWLVKFGRWERHPSGYGRRWFYRPIETPLSS
jgi:hypothetical protein